MFSLNAIDELLKNHEKTLKEELKKSTILSQNAPRHQSAKSVYLQSYLSRKTENHWRQKCKTA